jgi:hypothetical protein
MSRSRTNASDGLHDELSQIVRTQKIRVRGLTIRATDIQFVAGSGPVVQGPASSLIRALSGERAALIELSGTGFVHLARRMAAD